MFSFHLWRMSSWFLSVLPLYDQTQSSLLQQQLLVDYQVRGSFRSCVSSDKILSSTMDLIQTGIYPGTFSNQRKFKASEDSDPSLLTCCSSSQLIVWCIWPNKSACTAHAHPIKIWRQFGYVTPSSHCTSYYFESIKVANPLGPYVFFLCMLHFLLPWVKEGDSVKTVTLSRWHMGPRPVGPMCLPLNATVACITKSVSWVRSLIRQPDHIIS